MSMRHLKILIMVLFTFLIFLSSTAAAQESKYRITEVHDGDTVSIRVKAYAGIPLKIERARLIGIDAPELKQEPWGRKAHRHLKKLISQSDWVTTVEFDVEQRDKHGRLLVYLRGRDGNLINERMVAEGYAVLFTVPPNVKHADLFLEAERKARSQKRGIWGEKGLQEMPSEWRRAHPRSD